MKQTCTKFLSVAALLNIAAVNAADNCCPSTNNNTVATCFVPRSQGRDKVVQMVGSVGHTNLYDMESWYGTMSATIEYNKNTRSKKIADCLFGNKLVSTTATTSSSCSSSKSCNDSCDRTLLIQGCNVSGTRNPNALAAGNFFLPEDFSSEVRFDPSIRNVNVNLDFYIGLDEWLCGSYFRIHGPITNTRWDLDLCESVKAEGTAVAAGVLAPSAVTRDQLYKDFAEYAGGNRDLGSPVDSVKFNPLRAGRMRSCDESKTGFADLRFEFGWNFLQCEDYHLGLNLQAAAPTGTKKRSCFLFDTLIGNDKAELGGGLTAHYVFWRSEDEGCSFGFYFDASVTHLFESTENRVFDLKGKPLSRYMMASKFKTPVVDLQGTSNNPTSQFAGEYAPVANLTARDVDVSIGAQGDVVAMFNYSWCGWSFDLGYNFWGRSCEKIKEDCDCTTDLLKTEKWALRGNAQMYGFEGSSATNNPGATPAIPLSASQSSANICSCLSTAATGAGTGNGNVTNNNIDQSQVAQGPNSRNMRPSVSNITETVSTSVQPVFIKSTDIDYGARTRGISHKVFGHVGYTWDRECWIPYLGVGGFGEFGRSESRCDSTTTTTTTSTNSCGSCIDCALSQWGVWVKLGVSFN